MKLKVDAGTNQLITQLFFDNMFFYNFKEKCEIANINVPVQAGIMPVVNKKQIEYITKMCNVTLPAKFTKMMDRYSASPEAIRDAGIAYAVDQIVDLVTQGVDGIHLYTMNNPYVAKKIKEATRQCVFKIHAHLVFVTKYRKSVFTKNMIDDLKLILQEICLDFESELIEFNGEDDHVHLLVNYPPKVSISSLVNSLKGVSSRILRKKYYTQIRSKLWKNALWSPSYFAASCGGGSIDIIKKYIEQQRTPT